MSKHPYSASVAGAVIDGDRVLLIQRRDNGRWEPPGGILEHGETIEDGLRREIYEETGLQVEPGPLTGIYHNMPRHIIAMVFRCDPVSGKLTTNNEVAQFCWATAGEVRALATEAYAIRLLDAFQWRASAPAVRAHDGTNLLTASSRSVQTA
ncbi:MAG: NUDIX hydrolase [Micrococcales bacterium]|nr:NUDIX hydrolase [Micrococcales bacterium]